jgi:hypothetical protein
LFDSKQLHNFKGKFTKPNKPTVEELIPKITEAVDTRLKEMTNQLKQINAQLSSQCELYTSAFNGQISRISTGLLEIGKKI